MNQPLSPDVGYLTLLLIGGVAGWIVGVISEAPHWRTTTVLAGVAGSWLVSQLAALADIVVRGALGHFIAALIGSILILTVWERVAQHRRAFRA